MLYEGNINLPFVESCSNEKHFIEVMVSMDKYRTKEPYGKKLQFAKKKMPSITSEDNNTKRT